MSYLRKIVGSTMSTMSTVLVGLLDYVMYVLDSGDNYMKG